jgi:hypothetical protein
MTISELEDLLNRELGWDRQDDLEILPNGEIRAVGASAGEDLGGRKPLTFRENLGGEYATA